jgi:hypothetical protein
MVSIGAGILNAVALDPYAMAERLVTGLYNAPNHFYRSGYQFAQAYEQGSWAIAGSGAVDLTFGALGALPLAALSGVAKSSVTSADIIVVNKIENTALRERVLANIAESAYAYARSKSNFSVFSHKINVLNIELKAKTSSLSNSEVRYWYNETVATIPKLNEQWIRHGKSLEDKALSAYSIRHEARLQARNFMTNQSEVQMLQARLHRNLL